VGGVVDSIPTLSRTNFKVGKRKLLRMQNGGEKGIEIDDVHVTATTD
jgi:hypothetical protein